MTTDDLKQKWELEALAANAKSAYEANGRILPHPYETGERASPLAYRRELIKSLQYNSRYASVDLSRVPEQELGRIESEVFADAQANAMRPLDLAPGQIREIVKVDSVGRRSQEFVGGGPGSVRSIFCEFMTPARESPIYLDGVPKTALYMG